MSQLTNAEIASECERIRERLNDSRVASQAIIRIQIGVEETLLRYREAFGEAS